RSSAQSAFRSGGRLFSRARKRLREIERLLDIRHGGQVPFADDVEHYLGPVANCFRKIAADRGRPAEMEKLFKFWCGEHAADVRDEIVTSIAKKALAGPPVLITDDTAGRLMRVSYAERCWIKSTTLGSYDVDRAARKRLAKGQKRDR